MDGRGRELVAVVPGLLPRDVMAGLDPAIQTQTKSLRAALIARRLDDRLGGRS